MARLFMGPREVDFISDITKEFTKDVVGQRILYYPISEAKTNVHGVYNEAMKKVFDNPIIIDAMVDNNFQTDTRIDTFSVDAQYKIEAYVQYRDLVEKGINVVIGDFFSFGDVLYEIVDRVVMRNIYGMPEHKDGIKLIGNKARESQLKVLMLGPTDISRPEQDAVQTAFYQQRGQAENAEGVTGDKRALQENGTLEKPISGPCEVSERAKHEHGGSTFYDEE